MKKLVILSFIGLLIMAFGITAYAQAPAPVLEFKASGFIDVISELNMNVPNPGWGTGAGATSRNDVLFGPPPDYFLPAQNQAFDKTNSFMWTRGRLKFDAIMGKEMSGTFFFEFDSTRWGEVAPSGAQRNKSGHWSVADRSSMELKNMFITFGMPYFGIPVPITIQAGIHPLAIRPGAFLITDGPGVTVTAKVDPVNIKLAWFKALENKDWAADDVDVYALEAYLRFKTLTIGGYVFDMNANSYPGAEAEPSYSSDMWWYGFYADGMFGPFNFNADLVFNNGSVKDRRDLAVRARDVDYSGWGAKVNLYMPWDKWTFGFASIFGSGADQKKTSAFGRPGETVANTKDGAATSSKASVFITPWGSEGTVGDSLVLTGNGVNRMNTGFLPAAAGAHARAAFGGLWINKLYTSVKLAPWFKSTLEVMYIADRTDNGNTIGTARSGGFPRDDGDIGWELDLINEITIYKNLQFAFAGGYLFAGDAMDYYNTTTLGNESPKNPWVITTKLIYSF